MELKYKSIFKDELKDFIYYEKMNIKNPHIKETLDLDDYFINIIKENKTISENDYYGYINDFKKSKLNKSSRYNIIMKFAKYLIRLKYKSIFCETIRVVKNVKYNPVQYTDKELEKMIDIIDYKAKRKQIADCYPIIFRLYQSTGLRPSEPLKIKVRDINLKEKYIDIIDMKNYKSKRVYLSISMNNVLKKYMSKCDFLSDEQKIFPVNYNNTKRIFDLVLIDMGIVEKRRLHDLRHNFVIRVIDKLYYELKMDEDTILLYLKVYMGHSDKESSIYYTHMTEKIKKQIFKATNTSLYMREDN